MLRKLLIHIILIISFHSNSQVNIVPNPGFEDAIYFPTGINDWGYCQDWDNAGGSGSPDYFHLNGSNEASLPQCFAATIFPHSGSAIMGLLTASGSPNHENWREYIQCKLEQPMVIGVPYEVSFWLSNGEADHFSGHSSNHFGINLSTNEISQVGNSPINISPTLEIPGQPWSLDWEYHQFEIIADSSYEYLTIGNFFDTSATSTQYQVQYSFPYAHAYYFIDDLNIHHLLPPLTITGDTSICVGESVTLSAFNGPTYKWYDVTHPGKVISTDSIITVFPSETTTYEVFGNFDTTSFTVYVYPPDGGLPNVLELCRDSSVNIQAIDLPDLEYYWSDGSENSYISVEDPGHYWVDISHVCGNVTDSVFVEQVDCVTILEMPNVFTPNDDGVNDIFKPVKMQGVLDGEMVIINRWGNVVSKSQYPKLDWDGKCQGTPCINGTYFFRITYTKIDSEIEMLSGFLNLLR